MDPEVAFVVDESEGIAVPQATQQASFQKHSAGPCPFEVSLKTYPMQPWTNKNVDLSQWFNYGLNPSTWASYCVAQMNLYHEAQKKSLGGS